MNILLINPIPGGGFKLPFPVLPLGLACIASMAKDHGAAVEAISGEDYEAQVMEYLAKFKPDLVGFQTFVNNIDLCFELAREIKTKYPETLVILGGVEATNNPENAFNSPYVDCVISGEGEAVFRLLLEALDKDYRTVPGIIWRDESGEIKTNPGATIVENLDDLPEIPYELFYGDGPVPVGHVLTHRGCPFHCSHCPLRFRTGVTIRSHTAARIIATVENLKTAYGIEMVEFYDENFTLHHDFVRELCTGMASIGMDWICTARITQMDINLGKQMFESGCKQIVFGLGSGVPRIQEVLGTHEDLDHAGKLISDLSRLGMKVTVVFSLGVPTETLNEFNRTVRYGLRLDAHEIRFEPAAPLPGSELHHTARESGRFLINHWREYVRPGQLVYLPEGRKSLEFKFSLMKAKLYSRFKRIMRSRFSR